MKPSWRTVTWQLLRKAGVTWDPNWDLGFVINWDNALCSFWDTLGYLSSNEWTWTVWNRMFVLVPFCSWGQCSQEPESDLEQKLNASRRLWQSDVFTLTSVVSFMRGSPGVLCMLGSRYWWCLVSEDSFHLKVSRLAVIVLYLFIYLFW